MRILVHCPYFPPEVGGLESHVHQLCKAFCARGHRVDVVTSRSRRGLSAREAIDDIQVWRTPMPFRNPLGWTMHALGSVPRTRRLAARADIVHAQSFSSILPCLLAVAGRPVPLVATFHTSHFLRRASRPEWRLILRRLARSPSWLLATSQEIGDALRGLASELRVEALVNGVDTSFFRRVEATLPPAAGFRIVVPRRLVEKNGVEQFIRAFPRIVREIEDVEAVVVGDGPERKRIEGLIQALGLESRVRLLGARPHDEMPGILSSADLAVFPSLMEATSVAALESMACQVPVAASRVGGLPELVDERVGGLFQPADPADLARVVIALLRSDDLEERGERARDRVVRHWSNERLALRHLEIYCTLLERAAPNPSPGVRR